MFEIVIKIKLITITIIIFILQILKMIINKNKFIIIKRINKIEFVVVKMNSIII